jgi:5-methylcytosine-specific restriction endonuclease McrA
MIQAPAASTPRIRGRKWMAMKTDVLIASDHWCVMCRATGVERLAIVVDHRTPLWQGGSN